MQIKSLNNENTHYPKKEEINKNNLKNYIPKKWYKLGVTAGLYGIVMNSKVFANSCINIEPLPLEGGLSIYDPSYYFFKTLQFILLIILLLTSIIGIIVSTVKIKKNNELKKIKTIRIGFIILLVLTIIFYTISYFL